MRVLLDHAVSALARRMLRAFFRDIEILGLERIPGGVPLVIVSNHVNSVVDPLLLLAFVDPRARMLAKSTLWSHPLMGPLLVLAGALPVYRSQDHADVSKNFGTFARCHEALAAGGSVALFPEGRSHNQPHSLPFRTGAARIVLEAEARHGPLGVRVVPVGLTYEDKDRFRSRVLVHVADPIDPSAEAARYSSEPRASVRVLTARIADALDTVTVSYASWDEARLIELAASLAEDAQGVSLSSRFMTWKRFVNGYRRLKTESPDRVARVASELAAYDETLRVLSLRDEEVASVHPMPADALSGARTRRLLLSHLPLGVAGTLLNAVPYRVTAWAVARFARDPGDSATYTLLAGLVAFPVCWGLTALAAGVLWGSLAALVTLAAGPLTGYPALRLREERGLLRQASRGRGRELRVDLAGGLREQRQRLAAEVAALVGSYGAG